jgi:dihydrofolate reductase
MKKLVVGTFLTLDGVMQGPGAPEEDPSGGFRYGGWVVPYFDDMMGQVMVDWIGRLDALVLGRKTYEIFAAHWPHAAADDPIAAKFNRVPKYVASRSLQRADWGPASIIDGNVAEAIHKLKSESGDGELQVHGSGELIQALLQAGLIDGFRLWTFPVVLGAGKRLFAGGTVPASFQLTETRTSSTGVVLHVYQAAGRPSFGSFALGEPSGEEFSRRWRGVRPSADESGPAIALTSARTARSHGCLTVRDRSLRRDSVSCCAGTSGP